MTCVTTFLMIPNMLGFSYFLIIFFNIFISQNHDALQNRDDHTFHLGKGLFIHEHKNLASLLACSLEIERRSNVHEFIHE